MHLGQISQLRSFNRAITRRIGALGNRFVGRDRPMAESRMLYEIGQQGQEVRRLRQRMALDSGYASRLLRALEHQGLITVAPLPEDRRARFASLTDAGRRELAETDRAADDAVADILAPLDPGRRARLTGVLAEAERLIEASAVTFETVAPTSREVAACLEHYYDELDRHFATGFIPPPSVAEEIAGLTPPSGWILLARLYDEPVGCGTLTAQADFGEIKRVWIAERLRGLGLSRRLLAELENVACVAGFSRLRLDTNESLAEAQALYRSSGYHEIARFNDNPYAHHWFEKRLT
ncbi:MAG: helix-turn-helix domain-containing GNAT family N-acetyltransferase [Paracoccaceae bacterium]|nr:helix-turn-helix domain-containing GNAT family N-acetyltransferase [Paracoccaceae bacterium]